MATIEKQKRGRWTAGESGNPNGRKPGTGEVAKLRDNIAKHIPEIIALMVTKEKEGAVKLLLERIVPTLKPVEQNVAIDLPTDVTLSEQGLNIIQSVADGKPAPGQGSMLLNSLEILATIKELDEIEERLTTLEQANESKK